MRKVDRIIELFQSLPQGTALRAREVAQQLDGIETKNVFGNARSAIASGQLERFLDGATWKLRLGTGEPGLPSAESGSEFSEDPVPFDCAVWCSGELSIVGAQIGENGAVLLTADQVKTLKQFLMKVA